jgi:hypothetical protein
VYPELQIEETEEHVKIPDCLSDFPSLLRCTTPSGGSEGRCARHTEEIGGNVEPDNNALMIWVGDHIAFCSLQNSARIKVLSLSPEFWGEPPLLLIFCSPFWRMAHELVAKDGENTGNGGTSAEISHRLFWAKSTHESEFHEGKGPQTMVAARDRPEAVVPHPHTLHQSRWIMGRGDFSALDTFSCRHFGKVPLNNLFFKSQNVAISPALICFLCSQSGEPGTQQVFHFANFGIICFFIANLATYRH